MEKKLIFPILFFLLAGSIFLSAQEVVKVADIRANIQTYQNAVVRIEGRATQFLEGEPRHYLFKDDQEGVIKVRTEKPWPILKIRYAVTGPIVVINDEPILIEKTRIQREELYRIEDILRNPQDYVNEVVTIVGFATQFVEGTARTTSFYLLKDDWGGIIKVRTSRPKPDIGVRYSVSGPIGIDTTTTPEEAYLSEEKRIRERILLTEAATSTKPVVITTTKVWWKKPIYWLIGAISLVTISLIVVLITVVRRKEAPETIAEFEKPKEEEKEEVKIPEPEEVLEGDTIKMAMPPSGTLKMLPGRLTVLAGDDKIKEIRFFKTKAEEESEITFGRASGKPYTHIQLKPQSVSAKQAKIIYAGRKFTLINYSKTNPTHVNDVELEENGMMELNDGDKIQMGEVILEFHSQ